MNRNGERRQHFRVVFEVQDDPRAGATAIASAPPPFLRGNCCPAQLAVNFFTAPGGFSWETRHLERQDAVHLLHEMGHACIHYFHKGTWIETHPKNHNSQWRKGYGFAQAEIGKQRSRARC